MTKHIPTYLKGLLASAWMGAALTALGGANPTIPFYGSGGSITATPHYPVVGETAHIAVQVGNTGDTAAHNVQVKISFNDWGVTFQGWQEIATVTIPTIPAGGTATAAVDYIFLTHTHTCLEAVIVGASEDTDVNDDRGQINLEVVYAGEDFSYNVPFVNHGDAPLHLLVVGACKGGRPDGTQQPPQGPPGQNPPPPCREDAKEIVVGPGQEVFVPIHLDLHGIPPGQPLIFTLDAYDLGQGPNAFLPANHNHVEFRIFHVTARQLKKDSWIRLNMIAEGVANKSLKKKILEVATYVEKSLEPQLWLDENHLTSQNLGLEVFGNEMTAVKLIAKLNKAGLPLTVMADLEDVGRRLADADRILAQMVGGDLRVGDLAREAGNDYDAITGYKLAWRASFRR